MSKYFTLPELLHSDVAIRNRIENLPSFEQVENLNLLANTILDKIREKYGSPIRVTSGFRNLAVNAFVKGAKNSQHCVGKAADLQPYRGTVKDLFNCIEGMVKRGELEVGQLIDEYNYSWVHVSLPDYNHHNQILHLR